ncbi:hypothetical protein ATN89_17490 [Comamonas thiooxydans]|nr:hypothetical protein ATN89_17490 [Comamonas thiooxydans]
MVSVVGLDGAVLVRERELDATVDRHVLTIDREDQDDSTSTPYDPTAAVDSLLVILDGTLTSLRQPESGKSEGIALVVSIEDVSGNLHNTRQLVSISGSMMKPWVTGILADDAMQMEMLDYPIQVTGDLLAMDRHERNVAMSDAFLAIMSLPLVVRAQCKHHGKRLASITPEQRAEVAALDPDFLAAMIRAQIYEAAEAITDDPVRQARRDGLISMTVGESSQFFGAAKTLESSLGVASKKATQALGRWLDFSVRLNRG